MTENFVPKVSLRVRLISMTLIVPLLHLFFRQQFTIFNLKLNFCTLMQFLTAESQVIRWQIDTLFFHHLGNRQQLLHSCCKCSVVKCLCWSFENGLVFSMCEGTTYICFKFFELHLIQLMSKIGMSHQPFIVLEATNMAFKMWLMHLAHAVST